SCLPFPPTTAQKFGLIQEELADEPLNLLIACMLLNKTKGIGAIPKFWELMERYPTVDELVAANFVDLVEMLRPLGLQNRKSESLILLCKHWTRNPPKKGTRYRMMDYPFKGAHKDIPTGITLADDDPRVSAFEVCHLPFVGDYALDSWRIFCRDKLRGLADGYKGEGAEPGFEPEWKRVIPKDKELRAFLRWMWLREGWLWDPETGNKKRASEDKATASEL
ncbi:DNA glycosylase, partial [Phyllosticta capitalensis]